MLALALGRAWSSPAGEGPLGNFRRAHQIVGGCPTAITCSRMCRDTLVVTWPCDLPPRLHSGVVVVDGVCEMVSVVEQLRAERCGWVHPAGRPLLTSSGVAW